MRLARWLMLALALAFASGCAAPPGTPMSLAIAPGDYERAFDAAREAVLEMRFDLDRVDARAGVLSSRPKATSGLATPWDLEQTTPGQEISDLLNAQSRAVRITFTPEGGSAMEARGYALAPGDPAVDLRLEPGAMSARVEVVVLRTHRPGWRPDSGSVFRSGFAFDPALRERAMTPRYDVPTTQDEALARRLVERIEALRSKPGSSSRE